MDCRDCCWHSAEQSSQQPKYWVGMLAETHSRSGQGGEKEIFLNHGMVCDFHVSGQGKSNWAKRPIAAEIGVTQGSMGL